MTSPSSVERLFAEVYSNPDDDQIRRVLADALAFYESFEITPAMRSLKKLTELTETKLEYLRREHPEAAAHLEIVLDGSPDGIGVEGVPV